MLVVGSDFRDATTPPLLHRKSALSVFWGCAIAAADTRSGTLGCIHISTVLAPPLVDAPLTARASEGRTALARVMPSAAGLGRSQLVAATRAERQPGSPTEAAGLAPFSAISSLCLELFGE